jgi:hypothetical protein
MANAIDQAMVSKILNALTPTGTAGVPGTTLAALNGGAMKLKLTSTASSASASGTELSGSGYTTGGIAFGTGSTPSSAGSSVTCPAGSVISWTLSFSATIVSLEITDAAGSPLRVWFGNWNGQPISVASGNVFQVAVNAITITLT